MKLFAPDYYKKFSCIADKCVHNCCVGWEIDIDENTFEYYKKLSGAFGRQLADGIDIENGIPHFILSSEERCPFLNNNNLCDIILNLGESSLCQICADHPRYRNFFSHRTELGVGMCCEAAAKLILTHRQKMNIAIIEDDGMEEILSKDEQIFFNVRRHLFEIVQNRTISIERRARELLSDYDILFPRKTAVEWIDIYLGLEHLNIEWIKRLEALRKKSGVSLSLSGKWDTAFEQLLIYFLYRHTADTLYDGRFRERVAFSVLGFYIVRMLFAACENKNEYELIETARLYSTEIEYCEENIETLMEIFEEEIKGIR